MKVLIALDSLNRGGAETFVLDVCRNANRFGIELVVVAFGGGDLEAEFESGGFEFIRIDRRLPLDPNLVMQLKRLFKKKGIEVAHGFQPVDVLHLYLAAAGTKVKIVQTHEGYLKGWKNIRAARFVSSRVDANLSVSSGLVPWLHNELRVDTAKGLFVLHNAVDESRLKPKGNDIRAELGLNDKTLLCGMVANFIPSGTKDQMTVCRALAEILPKYENTAFVFVGNIATEAEGYFNRCKNFCDENGIGERVFFAGGRNDVPDILAALDVFVFSSLAEGLPVAVIEAMLAGVPMIVSDIPPQLEVTDEGNCAQVFRARDHLELSVKLEELLTDEKKRAFYAEAGETFALRHFTMESHFRSLKKIYSDLID